MGKSKSLSNISLYLIAACMVFFFFSINWNNFTQPSGIVYWRADVDPPSYEAITLQRLSNKGHAYITISSVLLLSILVLSFKRMHQMDSIQSDILLLWGIATITPFVLWSLSHFFFQRQLLAPKAVSMLIAFHDPFRFLTFLSPMIVALYITGIICQHKTLGRLAVFFALLCFPIIVSMNFSLDENNIQHGDPVGRMLAICFRFILPLILAVCSWFTLKTVQKSDNTSDRLADHHDNTTKQDTYLSCLGILWLAWGCIHLAIQFASIQTIANAYELIDGPLVDGTYELLNICFFCMMAFIFYRKHQRRGFDSIQSRCASALWTMCFFAVMIHEETVSIFIRSIAYDSYHVYFLYLTGASFVSVLPLLTYASCSILRTSQKLVIALGSLACSICSFLVPYIIEQSYFHITTNCISLFLPPFTLIAYSIIAGIIRKRQGTIQAS